LFIWTFLTSPSRSSVFIQHCKNPQQGAGYHIVIYNQMSSTIRPLIDNSYKSLSIVFSITNQNHPTNNHWLDHGTCPYSHDLSSFPTSWFYFKNIPVYRLYLRKSNWAYLFLRPKTCNMVGSRPIPNLPIVWVYPALGRP
jgi:hypothetical protein